MPLLTLFGPVWSIWTCRINLYERKELEGTPKDYLLGIDQRFKEGWEDSPFLKERGVHGICEKDLEGTPKDYLLGINGRLKEDLRAKIGLPPYQEEQCHGRIVHASKLWVFMEFVRKI